MLTRLLATSAIWVSICALTAAGAGSRPAIARAGVVPFPEKSRAPSSDGHFVLMNVDSDSEPHHTVFLAAQGSKARRKLFTYGRGVEVLWSPNSQLFIVNDYAGSDYSRCRVYPVEAGKAPIEAWDDLLASQSASVRSLLLDNHHVYIAAMRWVTAISFDLKAWGYGDNSPSGFVRHFSYTVGQGFQNRIP